MKHRIHLSYHTLICVILATGFLNGCGQKPDTGEDAQVTARGSVEVTAQLLELPEPAFPDIPLYDYAYVLKYKVVQVHRGKVEGDTIYVAHYNPLKPRGTVADARSGDIGGTAKKIQAGDTHRMALEVPIDDFFMGGIINKYFEQNQTTGPIYWAVWTNQVIE